MVAAPVRETAGVDPSSIVTEFIRRVVALDLASAGELVTDDIQYDNVPVGKNLGREAMIAFLSGMTTDFDEVEFVVHRQTAAGGTVMNERSDRFRIGDAWIDLPVAGVFEVGDDGRIALWRDYFDMQTFSDQRAAVAPDEPLR